MAHYCHHEVRFRGRVVQLVCRYQSPMSATVLRGKPLPELEGQDAICFYRDEQPHRTRSIVRAFMRLLRRQGHLNADGECDCYS